MAGHWKIWFLGGGVHEKAVYRADYIKGGSWTVCKFERGAWWKRGGSVFEMGGGGWGGGGLIPQCTLWLNINIGVKLSIT